MKFDIGINGSESAVAAFADKARRTFAQIMRLRVDDAEAEPEIRTEDLAELVSFPKPKHELDKRVGTNAPS